MNDMMLDRRSFLKRTAMGLCWLGGGRVFAVAASAPEVKPLLRFGVVSDIHFRLDFAKGKGLFPERDDRTFVHALEYFRDNGVDAVMVCGDLADSGLVEELESVAEAWNKVFPGDKAPNGRRVERLFVTGNHDHVGYTYANSDKVARLYPDMTERKRHLLHLDMAAQWERIFGEPYRPAFVKTVKGYSFIGAHYANSSGEPTALPLIAEVGGKTDSGKPFFFFQHMHLRHTCYGCWAWGRDDGKATKALSAFPNAVAFSGHSHYSLVDERSVWQGAFASFGAGSLSALSQTYDEFPRQGFENSAQPWGAHDKAINAAKVNPRIEGASRQGMLVSVYQDRMVLARRDFRSDLSLGPDWVLPFPAVSSQKPYAFNVRRKKMRAPQFAADAAVAVARAEGQTRGGEKKAVAEITFPPANAAADRVYLYEITAETEDGTETMPWRFIAGSYLCSKDDPRYVRGMSCRIASDELPDADRIRFRVRPAGWFGAHGRAVVSKWISKKGLT